MIGRFGSMLAPQVPLLVSISIIYWPKWGIHFSSLCFQGKYISSLPMILFGAFALCAAVLVFFLPETFNKELPDHIEDAVKFGDSESDSRQSYDKGRI